MWRRLSETTRGVLDHAEACMRAVSATTEPLPRPSVDPGRAVAGCAGGTQWLAEFAAAVRARHADAVHDVITCGSKARGDWHDDRDIDVLVIAVDGAAERGDALRHLAWNLNVTFEALPAILTRTKAHGGSLPGRTRRCVAESNATASVCGRGMKPSAASARGVSDGPSSTVPRPTTRCTTRWSFSGARTSRRGHRGVTAGSMRSRFGSISATVLWASCPVDPRRREPVREFRRSADAAHVVACSTRSSRTRVVSPGTLVPFTSRRARRRMSLIRAGR